MPQAVILIDPPLRAAAMAARGLASRAHPSHAIIRLSRLGGFDVFPADFSRLRAAAAPSFISCDAVGAPTLNFTRNNTSNTRRWATNADSRTARRHGEARKADARSSDARNTDGHGHARISAHDAFVRHSRGRQRAS